MLIGVEERTARRRLPAGERRRSIVDIAYGEFAERGYEAVTMREIAGRLGVTSPALYRQFSSKESLYAACAERLVEPMLATVAKATDPSLPPDGQLWAGINAQLRFIADHRQEWNSYVRQAASLGGEPEAALARGRAAVTDLLAGLIEQAARTAGAPVPPAAELDFLGHVLQGAVERAAHWWEGHPEQPVEAVAMRVMNFAWQGFGDLMEGRIWSLTLPAESGRKRDHEG